MLDFEFFQKNKARWNYKTYRLLLWMWMMNEFSVVFSTANISHRGFYIYATLYAFGAIFLGIPLVYSEICVAQYTNCNVITMWKFFPILKGVGWSSVYIVLLKMLYINVLSSWYLLYTFYGAFDPPPWFTCSGFNDAMCMIKSINVSTFQHCLEAQLLFDDDCGMKTASKCFFMREIGENTTKNYRNFPWKPIVASCASNIIILIFYIKRKKIINALARFLAFYVSVTVFVLVWVCLSIDGVWYTKKIGFDWEKLYTVSTFHIFQRGFLSCGTGFGIIGYLTHDVSFRSPATMTSIAVTLFSVFFTVILSLIIYTSVKAMSYYHGQEEHILEADDSIFFKPFASVSETLTYVNQMPIWSFLWYLTIYLFLFMVLWILYSFLIDNLKNICKTANNYPKCTCVMATFLIQILSYSFYYSDLTEALMDALEFLQLFSSLLFSISIYWVYGFNNHVVDITFMIGIKASYFWKTAWVLNPLIIAIGIYLTWTHSYDVVYNEFNKDKSINCRVVIFYILISLYFLIIIIGIICQLKYYFVNEEIKNAFLPDVSWGPQDVTLLKSRKMFVPEIMTREFLYRQVKIHGYCKKSSVAQGTDNINAFRKTSLDQTEWNALTSN